MVLPVGVSVRHVHVSAEDLEVLYGPGYRLTPADLYQEGEFAAKEVVALVGPRMRALETCDLRADAESHSGGYVQNRCCLSRHQSAGSSLRRSYRVQPITLVGPKALNLTRGAIIANRHIHMGLDDPALWRNR